MAGRQHSVALRAWESSDSHVDWFRATQSAIKRKLFNEKSGKQCRYVRSSSVKMGSRGKSKRQSGGTKRASERAATAGGPSKSDVDGGEQSTTPRTRGSASAPPPHCTPAAAVSVTRRPTSISLSLCLFAPSDASPRLHSLR